MCKYSINTKILAKTSAPAPENWVNRCSVVRAGQKSILKFKILIFFRFNRNILNAIYLNWFAQFRRIFWWRELSRMLELNSDMEFAVEAKPGPWFYICMLANNWPMMTRGHKNQRTKNWAQICIWIVECSPLYGCEYGQVKHELQISWRKYPYFVKERGRQKWRNGPDW